MDAHKSRNDDHPRSSGGAEVTLLPHQLEVVRDQGFRPEDIWWERKPGQRELNPLLLARIAERIQFDGDVPELRQGNLPEGGKPAVPVDTDTTDPVLLGHMLRCASLDVEEELRRVQYQWELGMSEKGEMLALDVRPVWSVPGYAPGQVPAPRKVGFHQIELCRLSDAEKCEAAFAAIATTQGRNSFVPAILRILQEGLEARGLSVSRGKREVAPKVVASWTLSITQANAHNPRFSPATTAAASILRDFVRFMPEGLSACSITVQAIHAIHDREVGWKAALYE